MNILIIDNSKAFTGAFKCAVNEAMLLSGDHRFVFVLPAGSALISYLQDRGLTVYCLPMVEIRKSVPSLAKYPFVLLANAYRLKSIIKKESIDVVQVNDFYNLLGAVVKMSGSRVKLLTYVRFLPSVIPSVLRNIWVKMAQKYSHRVIAVSDAVLNQLPSGNNTIRIYDPADLSETLNYPIPDTGNAIKLLYLSNYIRGKGQDYALEAFISAYSRNRNLRLTFIGGDMGMEKNKEFRRLLEEKVATAGLKEVVSFDTFTTAIEKEIKSADIVLNFSDSESFSMTCLEASYYGTPVIATRCGGPEEIVDDEKTGLLVHKADITGMTNAILKLADNPDLRGQMGKAAREYVRSKFSIENFKHKFERILAEV